MEHVKAVTELGAMMDDGSALPVAVKKQDEVVQQYNDFKFSRK